MNYVTGSVKIVGLLKNNKHVHLNRWYSHIELLETTQLALASLIGKYGILHFSVKRFI